VLLLISAKDDIMPTLIRVLSPAGLQDAPYQAASLAEAAQYEPQEGVYTVANTFERTKTLKLDSHWDRLENSARLAGIPLHLDRARVQQALRQMIELSGYGDVRFRVTVPQAQPEQLSITIEPFKPLAPEIFEKGVKAITAPNSARQNAAAKTTGWMHTRQSYMQAMPEGIYETFLCDESGHVLEGLNSNFYAVREGELRTAKDNVLLGISRQIVMEIAPPILAVNESPIHVIELNQLSEAFLTSASRGIVPVVEIDKITIGAGTPGPMVAALREAYQAWVAQNLQEL
jgi:branched-chain amino acid aminotransferase